MGVMGQDDIPDDGSYQLARWIARISSGLLFIAATILMFAVTAAATEARQSAAHHAYWYTILVVLGWWTLLRVTVYRHPSPREYGTGKKVPRGQAIASACLMSTTIVALDSLPVFLSSLVLGIAGGTMAGGCMYPAMFLIRRRIRGWPLGATPHTQRKTSFPSQG
jgi:hypothetical protein